MINKPKYGIVLTSMFKKDIKLAKKRGYDLSLLTDVIDTLANGQPLAVKLHRILLFRTGICANQH